MLPEASNVNPREPSVRKSLYFSIPTDADVLLPFTWSIHTAALSEFSAGQDAGKPCCWGHHRNSFRPMLTAPALLMFRCEFAASFPCSPPPNGSEATLRKQAAHQSNIITVLPCSQLSRPPDCHIATPWLRSFA